MPQIETWPRSPLPFVTIWLSMRDRKISLPDLNQLRIWIELRPEVPEGTWYKDFGSFKLCGGGQHPKTFLLAGQAATGQKL